MTTRRIQLLFLSFITCLHWALGWRRTDPFIVQSRRSLQRTNADRPRSLLNTNYFDFLQVTQTSLSSNSKNHQEDGQLRQQSAGLWPPWPFSLLSKTGQSTPVGSSSAVSTRHHPSLVFPFLQASTRAAVIQAKVLASQLWLHAPPAAPPLVLLALWPQRQAASDGLSKTVIVPLFTNPFVRSLALGGAGLAVMSWAHAQLLRKRLLTPLPPFCPRMKAPSRRRMSMTAPRVRQIRRYQRRCENS